MASLHACESSVQASIRDFSLAACLTQLVYDTAQSRSAVQVRVRVTRDKSAVRWRATQVPYPLVEWPVCANFDQREPILAPADMHVVMPMAYLPVDDLWRQQNIDLVQISGMLQNSQYGDGIEVPAHFKWSYGEPANTRQPRCAVQPEHHLGYTRVDAEHVRHDISQARLAYVQGRVVEPEINDIATLATSSSRAQCLMIDQRLQSRPSNKVAAMGRVDLPRDGREITYHCFPL